MSKKLTCRTACLSQSAVCGSPSLGPVCSGTRTPLPRETGGNCIPPSFTIKALLGKAETFILKLDF